MYVQEGEVSVVVNQQVIGEISKDHGGFIGKLYRGRDDPMGTWKVCTLI
jgi:hypothetical protein